jgi:hypothetical protein
VNSAKSGSQEAWRARNVSKASRGPAPALFSNAAWVAAGKAGPRLQVVVVEQAVVTQPGEAHQEWIASERREALVG